MLLDKISRMKLVLMLNCEFSCSLARTAKFTCCKNFQIDTQDKFGQENIIGSSIYTGYQDKTKVWQMKPFGKLIGNHQIH